MENKMCPYGRDQISNTIRRKSDCVENECALWIVAGEAENDMDEHKVPEVGGCALKIHAIALLKL